MIVERLRKELLSALSAWAESAGIPAPASLAAQAPPSHIAADLCLPYPLQAAKMLRRKPLEVAEDLAKACAGLDGVEAVSTAPPGFLNVRLSPKGLTDNLSSLLKEPAKYGADLAEKKRNILIEFVSANPTGPLHLASGRGATLGDSLKRILRRLGHRADAEYYVNDAGGRVELLGRSLRARWDQLRGKDTPVPEGGYQGEYLKDLAAAAPKEAEAWDDAAFGRYAMGALLATHKEDMAAFDVTFDRWFLESELYASKAVERTLDFLKSRGMTYEKESAVWLGTTGQEGSKDDKDRVLVKSTGTPTYFLPDIAYHKDKFDRGFDELIDIWGADHHGYVPRMKAAVAALRKDPASFHAIIHQLVHLFRGTEAVKMSKRAGTFIPLREVIDEAGKDACRFFFAQRTPNSHLNFDLELAKKQSNENPVFYVQYVHARIASIFREAEKTLGAAPDWGSLGADLPLGEPESRALLVKLAWFPAALRVCEVELSPHPLATYLMELAGLYHAFYEKHRVVDAAEPSLSRARLALCGGVKAVIAEGLGLLGVSAPERM